MVEPRKVWAVASGSYSDYAVDRLFDAEEDAERFVEEGHAEQVEEFALYPRGYKATTLVIYGASRLSNRFGHGVVERVTESLVVDDDGKLAAHYRRPKVESYDHRPGWWHVTARCTDREAAIKAAADRAAPIEAAEAGL